MIRARFSAPSPSYPAYLTFFAGLFLAAGQLLAQQPSSLPVLMELRWSSDEWMEPFGIKRLHSQILPQKPIHAGRMIIEVWEPWDGAEPTYRGAFALPRFRTPAGVVFKCDLTFYPEKLKPMLAANSYPATIEIRQSREGEWEEGNPTGYSSKRVVAFPEAYSDLDGSYQVFPLEGKSLDLPLPIFQLAVNRDGFGTQGGNAKDPEAFRKANPHCTHIVGWFQADVASAPVAKDAPTSTARVPHEESRLAVKTGDDCPPWSIVTAKGNNLGPSDYLGKVLLLDFWATWCGPCVASFPKLVALQKEFESAGLQVIGLSIDRDKTPEDVAMFGRRRLLNFPVGITPQQVETAFGVGAVPALVLVKDGKVILARVGVMDAAELRNVVADALTK